MQPSTIQFTLRIRKDYTDASCMFIWAMFAWSFMSKIVHNTLASISLNVSKATPRRTRAPNKTPALAQKWAVWSKPTRDLRHVTLTARKQQVYSKLVFNV